MLKWLNKILPAGAANERSDAQAAFERGDYPNAETRFRAALQKDAANGELRLGLANTLYAMQRYEEARLLAVAALGVEGNAPEAHYLLACIVEALGEMELAQRHFATSLELAPHKADAALRLILVLHRLGRSQEALDAARAGLAASPDNTDLLNFRANLHAEMGDLEAACSSYRAVLALQPDNLAALSNLGEILLRQEDPGQALDVLQRAADLDPYSAAASLRLGQALQRLGRADEALACYQQALAQDANTPAAHFFLGVIFREHAAFDEAIGHFRSALAMAPGDAETHLRLGEALLAAGQFEAAQENSREFLQTHARHPAALSTLGAALQGLGQYDTADSCYREVLNLVPQDPGIHFKLGTLRQTEGYFSTGAERAEKLDQARSAYRAALALAPAFIDAWLCLAAVELAQMRLAEAAAAFDEALVLEPENSDARTRRGQLALLAGDFESGWRDCEYRFGQVGMKRLPAFQQPQWRRDFPLAGKKILLLAEQGLGDAIHFIRYVSLVAAERPAMIYIDAHAPLRPLLQSLGDKVRILADGEPFPAFDCFCPLMSLPHAFATRQDNIPVQVPYLAAPPSRAAHWSAVMAQYRAPRLGMVWSGNPGLNNDFNRSIALQSLLTALPPAAERVFSLQKDVRATDQAALHGDARLVHLGDSLRDLGETAAVIASLDLIVTVDTSVAHLAGALGKPVWILLPFLPDWRWMSVRNDSPWYPTARLFRQHEAGDWSSTFAELRQALEQFFSTGHGKTARGQGELL